LLDANILSYVFLNLTGGQSKFSFSSTSSVKNNNKLSDDSIDLNEFSLVKFNASPEDILKHNDRVKEISEISGTKAIWEQYS